MSNYQTLIKTFNKLSTDQQKILYVLSVLYRSTTQTELKEVLTRLGWKSSQGKRLAGMIGKPWREALLKRQLLVQSNLGLTCHPLIVNTITRHHGSREAFAEIVEENTLEFPKTLPKGGFGYTNHTPLMLIRMAIYLEKEKKIWPLLEIKKPDQLANIEQVKLLLIACTCPLDMNWLQQRSAQVQLQVLASLLHEKCENLEDQHGLFHAINQGRTQGEFQQPGLAHALGEQQLWRGQALASDLLAHSDGSAQANVLRGWQAFLEDDNPRALSYFEEAILDRRKQTRKRNVILPGIGGIFYLLALLKSNNPEHSEQLDKQMEFAHKLKEHTPLLNIAKILRVPALIRSGVRPESDISIVSGIEFYSESMQPLLCALVQKWMGVTVDAAYIKSISEHASRAHEHGFLWYAREVAVLLTDLGKDKNNRAFSRCRTVAREAAQSPWPNLSAMIQVQQPWERALGALAALNVSLDKPPETASSTVIKPQRLAWLIEEGSYSLQPKEQKLAKNGKWSKGRAVSLKRLCEEADEIDYLSDADKSICQFIEQEAGYSYYGSYGNNRYFLPVKSALQAALDHPHIYWPDVEKAVDVKRMEPELHIQKQSQHITISMSPMPIQEHDETLNYAVREQGRQRLELVNFSSQQLQIATILGKDGLQIPASAEQQALQSLTAIAPLLTVHSDIAGLRSQGEEVDPEPCLLVQLQPSGQGLSIAVYSQPLSASGPLFVPASGAASVFADIDGRKVHTRRDLKAEKSSFETLQEACPCLQGADFDKNQWQFEDNDSALTALLELQALGDSVHLQWPQGSPIKIHPTQDLSQMRVAVSQQQDWFAVEGGLSIGGDEVVSLQKLLKLLEQSPGRFVELKGGEFLALTQGLQQRLSKLAKYTDDGRFHPLASPVLDELTEGMQVSSSQPWKEQTKRLRQAYALTPKLPTTLQASLRDYQLEGFNWLSRLAHWGAGACLADDMGLGKTLQSLALILSRASNGPTLVLAPTSVCFNWQEEALRFAPTLKVHMFASGDREKMLAEAGPFDVIVCSYGLLQTQAPRLQAVHWHTLIADEAQALKNPHTKRSKGAMALNADFKMIATGTPIENHLGELWNLFNFINPGLLGSLDTFTKRFANPIQNQQDQAVGQQLKQLVQPFILRRLKSEVLTELPSRTEITVHVQASKEEKVFYEALRRNALEKLANDEGANAAQQRIQMLAEIMRLRRACCHPQLVMPQSPVSSAKLAAFGEILDELLDNHHKALVFSQFVGHLDILRAYLDKRGVNYQYLDGSTPAKKRQKAVQAFQGGDGDLFLISLKAGGSGLNLTAADYVIHMDPWWNPAVEDQASDRAHRMGQKRPVTIYRLVVQDTIEDKIVQMHQQKRELANNLLEGTGVSGKISLQEMMNLIKG
ncbi:MAG: DEAD/DEAH box helicase, partial [Bermanella sp.]